MRKIFLVLLLGVVIAVLSGCALTNENVRLNYTPNISSFYIASHAKPLRLGQFTDERGENPRLIAHKINLNNQEASGMLLAQKPIAEILKNAISGSLEQAGYHLNAKSHYVLRGNLLSMKMTWFPSFFYADLHCNIQFEFILSDANTGRQIWETVYNGQGIYHGKTDRDQPFQIAFSRASNALIRKLLMNTTFRKLMKA